MICLNFFSKTNQYQCNNTCINLFYTKINKSITQCYSNFRLSSCWNCIFTFFKNKYFCCRYSFMGNSGSIPDPFKLKCLHQTEIKLYIYKCSITHNSIKFDPKLWTIKDLDILILLCSLIINYKLGVFIYYILASLENMFENT